MTNPKNKTTVTFDDGTVARRTTERAYTHAVAVSAEIPELVRPHLIEGIAADEKYLAMLAEAIEKMEIVVANRGFHTQGKDLGHDGKPSWSNYEAALLGTRSDTDHRYTVTIHCNSESISRVFVDGEGYKPVPARDVLKKYAEHRYEAVTGSLAAKRKFLAQLDAGTYDLGKPEVLRWSSREELAIKALNSEFNRGYPTRRLFITAVDS